MYRHKKIYLHELIFNSIEWFQFFANSNQTPLQQRYDLLGTAIEYSSTLNCLPAQGSSIWWRTRRRWTLLGLPAASGRGTPPSSDHIYAAPDRWWCSWGIPCRFVEPWTVDTHFLCREMLTDASTRLMCPLSATFIYYQYVKNINKYLLNIFYMKTYRIPIGF